MYILYISTYMPACIYIYYDIMYVYIYAYTCIYMYT